jgi:hypothetical protein
MKGVALLCYSFSGITDINGHQFNDIWSFDSVFLNVMLLRLKKSPLFTNGISTHDLKGALSILYAFFSLEDTRATRILPQSILITDKYSLTAYYKTAFRALDSDLLPEIWQRWLEAISSQNSEFPVDPTTTKI